MTNKKAIKGLEEERDRYDEYIKEWQVKIKEYEEAKINITTTINSYKIEQILQRMRLSLKKSGIIVEKIRKETLDESPCAKFIIPDPTFIIYTKYNYYRLSYGANYIGAIAYSKTGGMNDLADGDFDNETVKKILKDIRWFETAT